MLLALSYKELRTSENKIDKWGRGNETFSLSVWMK